jgi:hypothetical protein
MTNVFRHASRPLPSPVIRRKSDVVTYVDGSMDFTLMTHREQMELHRLTANSLMLYGLHWAMSEQLGIPPITDTPTGCVLDHDAWERYEAEERVSA